MRAKGKLLLENTQVSVTAGRRYGLVGPNGKGKSTLLRLIARRQIPVPEALDVLLVEQVCIHLAVHLEVHQRTVMSILQSRVHRMWASVSTVVSVSASLYFT